MAVYTTLSELQVNKLLVAYGLPPLLEFVGAKDGIENTTYFLTLEDQRSFVLTVFEQTSAADLAPYINLTIYLRDQQLPIPAPLADLHQQVVQILNAKPAWLVPKMPGTHCHAPTPTHCYQLGEVLARCHLATAQYGPVIQNPCGIDWLKNSFEALKPILSREEQRLLSQQLEQAGYLQTQSLPRGIIHGDLFRDNVLFNDGKLSALIDFNNAGTDFYLLDLAITVNDWCFTEQGQPLQDNSDALMNAYQGLRPLSEPEQNHWQHMLQLAATRFWVSRLWAAKKAHDQALTAPKNPQFFLHLLQYHLK